MPTLSFAVTGARGESPTVSPTLSLALAITNAPAHEAVHSIALRCQVKIDAQRRSYTGEEQAALDDVFGAPSRWATTLAPILWTHAQTTVPAFQGACAVELPLACSWDFSLGATKYLHGLEGGSVPLHLLFSGTVFYAGDDGRLQVAPVPWSAEARFILPLSTWRDAMEGFAPGAVGMLVERAVFERLERFRRHRGLATIDAALVQLLGTS